MRTLLPGFGTVLVTSVVLALLSLADARAQSTNSPWDLIQTRNQLPDGPLYWQLQTFETREAAEGAGGPTALIGEAEGTVWLFSLGRRGDAPRGGTLVAEIGPLEVPELASYQLQINYRTTPAGVAIGATQGMVVHYHPGVESFYVLAGEQAVWVPGRQDLTGAGESWKGEPAGTPMVVVNTGTAERRAFTLYVGDAGQPWVLPANFPIGVE